MGGMLGSGKQFTQRGKTRFFVFVQDYTDLDDFPDFICLDYR
jgi:hypothetical protein